MTRCPRRQWKPEPVSQLFAGSPDSYLQGSAQSEDVRGNSIYLFAQDSWKIRRNLTSTMDCVGSTPALYDAGCATRPSGRASYHTYPCQLMAASRQTSDI